MRLSDIKTGQAAYVCHVEGSDALKRHLEELGFVVGQRVVRSYATPAGTPIVYTMMGQRIALRRREAERVEVYTSLAEAVREGIRPSTTVERGAQSFPLLAKQCEGHCAGCTRCHHTKDQTVAGTPPEKLWLPTIALVGNPNCGKTAFFNAATGRHERTGNYAGVTVGSTMAMIFGGTNYYRLVDLPGTYSLRAYSPEEAYVANRLAQDDVRAIINVIDVTNLERNLLLTLQLKATHLPVIGVLNMYDELEASGTRLDIDALSERLGIPLFPASAVRGWESIKEALHAAEEAAANYKSRLNEQQIRESIVEATRITPYVRSREIRHLLKGIYQRRDSRAAIISAKADKLLAASLPAYLLFILVMGLIFFFTFEIGAWPQAWMESGVEALSEAAGSALPPGWLNDLLTAGIIGGVGSVIVFLPNILILYFFISILEDSGYISRAALLADPLLRRVGLHGKSFFPMLMGFGCNVPAIMATRTIESRKSRLITMMTLPFMSCSARLPVYTVISGAFFPEYAALVMLGLYTTGIAVSFCSAALLSRVMHRSEESHLVMEMPPYRRPVIGSVLRHTWEKGREYLRKMGGVILIASITVWALGYFPVPEGEVTPAERQEQSYLGRIGHTIEPAIAPMGYDWRMGVGILSGIGAKELMVTSLAVLYTTESEAEAIGTDDEEAASRSLGTAMRRSGISWQSALSFLVFALLYFPCTATIAAIRSESGRWKYAIFTAVYTTALAYAMALLTYHVAMSL